LRTAEKYAEATRSALSQTLVEPPHLEIVQALLVFSMYEWGNGNGYKAWMYSGVLDQFADISRHDNAYDAVFDNHKERSSC
jgi:hypothetical protein